MALHHLRLGPHRDGGHDDQREDEQPPFPAGQGDEPVVGEIAGGKGRQRLHTFPRPPTLEKMAPTSMSIPTSMTTPCMASV